jgi:hypothetical protein
MISVSPANKNNPNSRLSLHTQQKLLEYAHNVEPIKEVRESFTDSSYNTRKTLQENENSQIKQRLLDLEESKSRSTSSAKGSMAESDNRKSVVSVEMSDKSSYIDGLKGSIGGSSTSSTIDAKHDKPPGNELHAKWMADSGHLFTLIVQKNQAGLDDYELVYEEKKEEHQLKIYMQTYLTEQKNRVNRTRTIWFAPCTAEQFIKFMNNVVEQNKLDPNMSDFRQVETFEETPTSCNVVYYLAYKKMLIASARDFVYVKHYKNMDELTWCDASKSVSHPDLPEYPEKVRGEIVLSGHFVTDYTDENTGMKMAKICMYSETDFKTGVPFWMAKNFSKDEIKKYIEKCIARIKVMHPQESKLVDKSSVQILITDTSSEDDSARQTSETNQTTTN